MRIVVTGGLGFIGCNLSSRLLHDGHELVIYDNARRAGVLENLDWLRQRFDGAFRWVNSDIRDREAVRGAVQGAQVIFHLAGQVAVTTSVLNPQEDFDINAGGTLNVLEAARELRPPPIVLYTSTNKVYGGLEGVEIVEDVTRYRFGDHMRGIRETFPLDFHSPYGCSKGTADQYVRDYYRIFKLPTVVFRMSCIYGPRQLGTEDQGWVAHMARTVLQGGSVTIYGDGKQVRDLLYIDDLVDAMLKAVERIDCTAGQVYNIGGGPSCTVSVWVEFRQHLQKLLLCDPKACLGPWRPGDQRIYISDTTKAQQDLDWTPRIQLADGVRRMTEEWKSSSMAATA